MKSGWCNDRAAAWSHDRCRLEGCTCPCHAEPEVREPLLWKGDQA